MAVAVVGGATSVGTAVVVVVVVVVVDVGEAVDVAVVIGTHHGVARDGPAARSCATPLPTDAAVTAQRQTAITTTQALRVPRMAANRGTDGDNADTPCHGSRRGSRIFRFCRPRRCRSRPPTLGSVRLLVLSDTHLSAATLDRMPAEVWDLADEADAVLHAGDVVDVAGARRARRAGPGPCGARQQRPRAGPGAARGLGGRSGRRAASAWSTTPAPRPGAAHRMRRRFPDASGRRVRPQPRSARRGRRGGPAAW